MRVLRALFHFISTDWHVERLVQVIQIIITHIAIITTRLI